MTLKSPDVRRRFLETNGEGVREECGECGHEDRAEKVGGEGREERVSGEWRGKLRDGGDGRGECMEHGEERGNGKRVEVGGLLFNNVRERGM